MKQNVTLKLDAAVLKRARALAAKDGRSLSGFLSHWLVKRVREEQLYAQVHGEVRAGLDTALAGDRQAAYEAAKARALAYLRTGFDLGFTPGSRDELHER